MSFVIEWERIMRNMRSTIGFSILFTIEIYDQIKQFIKHSKRKKKKNS